MDNKTLSLIILVAVILAMIYILYYFYNKHLRNREDSPTNWIKTISKNMKQAHTIKEQDKLIESLLERHTKLITVLKESNSIHEARVKAEGLI